MHGEYNVYLGFFFWRKNPVWLISPMYHVLHQALSMVKCNKVLSVCYWWSQLDLLILDSIYKVIHASFCSEVWFFTFTLCLCFHILSFILTAERIPQHSFMFPAGLLTLKVCYLKKKRFMSCLLLFSVDSRDNQKTWTRKGLF